MASELTRTVWCDVHGADDRRDVPELGLDVPFRVGKISVVMDLCEDCITKNVDALAEFLQTYGRKPSTDAPSVPAADGTPRLTCPECGKLYSYRNSLVAHVREIHGKVLPRQRASSGSVVCPHCSRTFAGPQGLASHTKSAHADHWEGPHT